MTRVAKWGNSPAVRIPRAAMIEAGLKDGDAVVVTANSEGGLTIMPDRRRQEALEALGRLRWELPPGYKFDRAEANGRNSGE